jgi:hypothetical protein
MWLARLLFGGRKVDRRTNRRTARLTVEPLEDRWLPSSYTAASVSDLIADINAANLAGGSNTITLADGSKFTLTAVNNATNGNTGLPVIAANDNLTIVGNGDTIERSSAAGTLDFRLFAVASGASLSLSNLTVQNGLEKGPGAIGWMAEGGAILNVGSLTLSGVTVQGNVAANNVGSSAGGGIFSSGTLDIQAGSVIQNNQAIGAAGFNGYPVRNDPYGAGGPGFNGLGGGIYVGGGTATLNGVTLSGNAAIGGQGGNGASSSSGGRHSSGGVTAAGVSFTYGSGGQGGNAFGGALYAAGGTITLLNSTVTKNSAQGGKGGQGASSGSPGLGEGGGLYIDPAALAYLDAFTQANIKHNHASTSYDDIFGSFATYP